MDQAPGFRTHHSLSMTIHRDNNKRSVKERKEPPSHIQSIEEVDEDIKELEKEIEDLSMQNLHPSRPSLTS